VYYESMVVLNRFQQGVSRLGGGRAILDAERRFRECGRNLAAPIVWKTWGLSQVA
jgi:hypothetical protein